MSQWITDRLPTEADGVGYDEIVWIWAKPIYCEGPADIFICEYWNVKEGTPWAPMLPPEPYVDLNTELQELKAENERLRNLCSKYERIHNALQEACLIS